MQKTLYFCVICVVFLIAPLSHVNAQGGVAVNTAGTAPDNSALFDISSVNKGFLIPRMTTAQRDAIVNPAEALQIYNTDCKVYNYNAGTPENPNWVTINSTNALIAGVSISASPVGAICSGTNVTFTATPANGINSPTYQWKVNGSNVGSNSTTYTSSALNNGDVVTCILSSSAPCVTGSPATSNSITMTVNPAPATPGSITGNTNVCENSSGNIYSISPVAGATTYNWTVPGDATIASGSGNTSITVTFGSISGNISVNAINSCGTSSASSQVINVIIIPSTPGSISGNSSVCPNATGQVYSINAVSGATSYNWTLPPGAGTTASTDTGITVTFGNNPTGNVSVSASNNCGTSGQSTLLVSQPSLCPPVTFSYTGGMQLFTIPAGVTSLTVEAKGAQGGTTNGENGSGPWNGGLGADIKGTFSVTAGQVINILVGGAGSGSGGSCSTGGGGGSWAVSNGVLLLVAGGGGGGFMCNYYGGANGGPGQAGNNGGNGIQATGGNSGTPQPGYAGGNSGNGGSGCYGGGGGGWLSAGNLYCAGGGAGAAYPGGAASGGGGFGGGAGAYAGCCGGSGGGGGYSGGSGGTSDGCAGGGGGSYNSGTNQTNTAGVQTGNGQVILTW